MNELIFAQLYYKEINNRLLLEDSIRTIEERNRNKNFISGNKIFTR